MRLTRIIWAKNATSKARKACHAAIAAKGATLVHFPARRHGMEPRPAMTVVRWR